MIDYYKLAAQTLIREQKFPQARDYLQKAWEIGPDAYITRWLGVICFHDRRLDSARLYLSKSLAFDDREPQVWLNLALIYSNADRKKSLKFVDEALALDSEYEEALDFRRKLSGPPK